MYTDDKNAQIVLSLLKEFGIKKIVVSPGMTNVPVARSVQIDSYFEAYSVVDERSAAYFATGLSHVSGEPVALSCTGATASRNYLSGLTEAYYRKLPILALTSQHHSPDYSDLLPQLTDRTVSQNDIKLYSAMLPEVNTDEDLKKCIFQVNKALNKATTKGGGPVHINIPVSLSFSFKTESLPDIRKIDFYDCESFDSKTLADELSGKRVGIFIGSHKVFDKATIDAINDFVKKADAAVFCDHTSSFTGENQILISQASDLIKTKNTPDLIIDMGSISGDYSAPRLFKNIETWRISEDGQFHNRHGIEVLRKVFECSEKFFFRNISLASIRCRTYHKTLQKEVSNIKIPKLPLSATYVASKLSQLIPKNSLLHLGILNSLRNMNFFKLDKSILASSNVGGFGIDGPISTLVGQSLAVKDRLCFGVVGDLASFYDLNALSIRHIAKNLRILVVNNGCGVEFRLNSRLEDQWGSDTDQFTAAAGHRGSIGPWAESCGFHYISASNKESFDKSIQEFCNSDIDYYDKPVLFEVPTTVADEQQAVKFIRDANYPIVK